MASLSVNKYISYQDKNLLCTFDKGKTKMPTTVQELLQIDKDLAPVVKKDRDWEPSLKTGYQWGDWHLRANVSQITIYLGQENIMRHKISKSKRMFALHCNQKDLFQPQ